MKLAKLKMRGFKEIIKCACVKTIQDINDKFSYEDKIPGGKGDNPMVSCGQDKESGYNELENIYKSKLKKYINTKEITEKQAIDALCEACHELDNPRKRTEFYKYLSDVLEIEI